MLLLHDMARSRSGYDFFALLSLRRVSEALEGIINPFEGRNILVVGALVRIQAETTARLSAYRIVADPNQFFFALGTKRFDRQTDKSNFKLTTKHLCTNLGKKAEKYSKLCEIFEQYSNRIHTSIVCTPELFHFSKFCLGGNGKMQVICKEPTEICCEYPLVLIEAGKTFILVTGWFFDLFDDYLKDRSCFAIHNAEDWCSVSTTPPPFP